MLYFWTLTGVSKIGFVFSSSKISLNPLQWSSPPGILLFGYGYLVCNMYLSSDLSRKGKKKNHMSVSVFVRIL